MLNDLAFIDVFISSTVISTIYIYKLSTGLVYSCLRVVFVLYIVVALFIDVVSFSLSTDYKVCFHIINNGFRSI
jgi:uncharacterized membrane protein